MSSIHPIAQKWGKLPKKLYHKQNPWFNPKVILNKLPQPNIKGIAPGKAPTNTASGGFCLQRGVDTNIQEDRNTPKESRS